MAPKPRTVLELFEYAPIQLASHELSKRAGLKIWQTFGRQVAVEFPSAKTDEHWQLTAQGWAGLLPVTPELTLVLRPKIALQMLWSMLAYAFGLRDLHIGDKLVKAATLPDLYEQLALIFAQRVLKRRRQGLAHTYQPTVERRTTVRGRVRPVESLRRPWDVALTCQYDQFSADIEDNQLLLWTLDRILRGRLCSADAQRIVMSAFHALRPSVSLRPFRPAACQQRHYDRLTEDYRALHALCYFFLAQTAPFPAVGDSTMLPFCLHMATLFERFVAAWLTHNLGDSWRLNAQETYRLDSEGNLAFRVDMVVRERVTGRVRWVLDTKYSTPHQTPAASDVAQVLAYAHAARAAEAILVFPTPIARPLDVRIGGVRVRSLTFDLRTDVEVAGQAFLRTLDQPAEGKPSLSA